MSKTLWANILDQNKHCIDLESLFISCSSIKFISLSMPNCCKILQILQGWYLD